MMKNREFDKKTDTEPNTKQMEENGSGGGAEPSVIIRLPAGCQLIVPASALRGWTGHV